MTSTNHHRSSLLTRLNIFSQKTSSDGLIAIITSSTQRVRQISEMLKSTSYNTHRVVWLPCDTFLQHAASNASFDVVLMDVENHDEHVASTEVKHWCRQIGDSPVIVIGGKDTNRFHFSTLFKRPAGLIPEDQLNTERLEKELQHAKVPELSRRPATTSSLCVTMA